ncbi:MAG: putative hydro-lyase [Magnetovibrionaceae bacterium]
MSIKATLTKASPEIVRAAIRRNEPIGDTAGLCGGYLQGNLAILPSAYALDFLKFCQRNPKPCPVLAVSETGDPMLPTLGDDIDIRTDVPRYRVFEEGRLIDEVDHISDIWRDDFVSFVLGCSFSFEEALVAEGIEVRHIAQGRNVSMYRTNISALPSGPFRGEYVVSMRPMTVANAIRAIEITARFPEAHGTPLHFGDPAEIGIQNLEKPDFGDSVEIKANEIPVFWACGVTPQVALTYAKPSICITHAPGYMLITDRRGAAGAPSPTKMPQAAVA